ncbi:hypothetical protein EPO56_03490 [Patescibacteria group bacterium]|nr:MAG: hypothetical protein EPO56_03490 [Patescibacteria group bacterium]
MPYHPEDCFQSPSLNRRSLIPLDERPDTAPNPEEWLLLKEEVLRDDRDAFNDLDVNDPDF